MPDKDARSREEEYFWKKDQELIEKMRRAAAAEQAKRDMGAKAGLNDPEMIQELQALGFTTRDGRAASADTAGPGCLGRGRRDRCRAAADRESSAVVWHRRWQRHGSSAVGVAGQPSGRAGVHARDASHSRNAGLVVAGANRTHGRRPRHALRKHCRRVGRRARHEAHFGRGACADLDDCLRVESTRRVRGELVPTPSRPTTADCGLQLTPATQNCVSPSVKQAKVRPQDNLRCGKPASGEPAVPAV